MQLSPTRSPLSLAARGLLALAARGLLAPTARGLLALALCAGAAHAQFDTNPNWHAANGGFLGGLAFVDGPGLFGALSGDGHYAGPGDAIRVCYGIDNTQGGGHQDGLTQLTWIQLVGGYPASNTVAGLEFGLTSLSVASVDSLEGDACFSPFFGQGVDSVTGAPIQVNTQAGFAFVPGLVSGLTPFPSFWFVYLNFLGQDVLELPNRLGDEPAGVGTFVDPLLTNLIFEVQGPVNFGPNANVYYLATTAEDLGLGFGGQGTGGVTNGNGLQGFGLSGVTADLSGAVAHSRLTALSNSGSLEGFFNLDLLGSGQTGSIQWFNEVATRTPALWAAKDGFTGGGATDLSIGESVSSFQWRLLDGIAGNQANPQSAGFDPSLTANLGFALYSRTPAVGMLQTPMSWDTLFGNLPGRPGSIVLGEQPTLRAGLQTVPANFDPLMAGFLVNQPSFTLGTEFTPSDPFSFGTPDGVGGPSQSFMPAPIPIASQPHPELVGTKLGVAAVGIQLRLEEQELRLTEFGNGMTLNLQP